MATAEVLAHRILVVEDNRTNALLLEQVLQAEGHHVEIAQDGLEALCRIAQNRPDLILLDLEMPNLDGYEVCRRVKSDAATRFIPIIILTAQTAFETKLRTWELGDDEFLTKPFQNLEIVARCRSLLRVKVLVDELDSAEAVMFALARTLEAKNPYTQGHSQRVASYSLALADRIRVRRTSVCGQRWRGHACWVPSSWAPGHCLPAAPFRCA
jgi:putative two-component system response regulator